MPTPLRADAFDLGLIASTLEKLKHGQKVEVACVVVVLKAGPHLRLHYTQSQARDCTRLLLTLTFQVTMYGANVIIFEGILAFASPELRNLMDLKIFVDEDADIRLARRYCL